MEHGDEDLGSGPGRRRWVMLFTGCGALIAACTFQYGLPYLISGLLDDGMSLAQAGLLREGDGHPSGRAAAGSHGSPRSPSPRSP